MQSAQKTDWVPGIRALCTKENKKRLYGKKYKKKKKGEKQSSPCLATASAIPLADHRLIWVHSCNERISQWIRKLFFIFCARHCSIVWFVTHYPCR